jgi:hypothetical protein
MSTTPDVQIGDLPDGDWYVEAREGDTAARILFSVKTLLPAGEVPGFMGGATHLEHPRVVVLTPRPTWTGQPDEVQGPAHMIDGRPTFVVTVPAEVAEPIIDTLTAYGLDASREALARFLNGDDPVPSQPPQAPHSQETITP